MKNKMMKLERELEMSERQREANEEQISNLKTENIKLTSDIKIIRNDHSELLHNVYQLEKTVANLQTQGPNESQTEMDVTHDSHPQNESIRSSTVQVEEQHDQFSAYGQPQM